VLLDARRMAAPKLGASYDLVDLRTPHLRVMRMSSQRVVTDYTLLDRALPYAHRKVRPSLLVVLEGRARFEERGRRAFLAPGDVVRSDGKLGGTEAHGGDASLCLAFEWSPDVHGAAFDRPFVVERLAIRDRSRLARAARDLDGDDPTCAAIEIIDVLRAAGMPFDRPDAVALREGDRRFQPLVAFMSRRLSALHEHPALVDVQDDLGWDARRVRRAIHRMARSYGYSWTHWREGLHQARLLHALRLLAVPGATTEIVGRLTGFRAPSALCHAFADAGLPSPGRFASAGGDEALERWSELRA
jgi:hypothetical protein